MMRLFRGVVAIGFVLVGTVGKAQDPMLRVELSHYQQLTADIASLSAHVQNPMLNMGLVAFGNLVGSPGLLGIDQDRPMQWALFSEGGGGNQTTWVMVLPVTEDGQAFLENLSVSYDVLRDDGVLRRFRANRPVRSFREMSVQLLEGRVVASPSEPLVHRVVEMLRADPDALAPTAISGTLRVSIDVAAALPRMRLRLDETTRAADAQGGPKEGVEGVMAESQRIYADALLVLLEQARTITLGLQSDPLGLSVYSRLDVHPETLLSKFCDEAAPPSARLLSLLPPDAIGVAAGGTLGGFLRHGMGPYLKFAGKLLEVQGRLLEKAAANGEEEPPALDTEAFLARLGEAYQGYGDEFVMSVGRTGDDARLVFFEAVTLTDGPKVLEVLPKSLEWANETYARAGIPFRFGRREDRKAGDILVQTYGMTLTQPEPAADGANEDGTGLLEPWRRMRETMGERLDWIEKVVLELAVSDDVLLLTLGLPGSLDPFLGRLQAPSEEVWSSRSKTLFPEIRNHDKAVEFWLLKPLELARALLPLLDREGLQAEWIAKLDKLPSGGAGMGGLTMASPTTGMGVFRISAECLGVLAQASAELQRTARPRAGGAARPPAPPRGDPVDVVLPED